MFESLLDDENLAPAEIEELRHLIEAKSRKKMTNQMIDALNSFATPLFWLLVLIQISLAIAVGITFVKWLQPQARTAHRILLGSLAMVFVVPAAAVLFCHLNLGLIPVQQTDVLAATSELDSRPSLPTPRVLDENDARYLGTGVPQEESQPAHTENRFPMAPAVNAAVNPDSRKIFNRAPDANITNWWAWFLLLIAPGIALMALAKVLLGILQSFKTLARTSLIRDPELESALERAKNSLGIRAEIQLKESSRTRVPIIWLWGRKSIVLPCQRSELVDVDWYSVFLHELSHLVRRDHLSTAFATVVRAILPWHPLVRMAQHMLIEAGEKACDRLVLNHMESPQKYASTLVAFQIHRQSVNTILFSPMAVERQHLKDRIQNILIPHDATPSRPGIPLAAISLSVLFAAVLSPVLT